VYDLLICLLHVWSQFDVVYTSWLSRAIETGWLVMNELDALYLPIVKTWRLNERMCKCGILVLSQRSMLGGCGAFGKPCDGAANL
jgi:hypothetical protein